MGRTILILYSSSRDNGIDTYDAQLQMEILLGLSIILASSDNPMICEVCSHIGLQANKFCPRCHAGGKKEHKTSNDGFHALYRVSGPSLII